jgi:hypothetical protein
VPPRDSTVRLHDIIEAISRILRYTAHHSLESFADEEMAVDAVVRNLEVIGEAARHVDETTAQRGCGETSDPERLQGETSHQVLNARDVRSRCLGQASPSRWW